MHMVRGKRTFKRLMTTAAVSRLQRQVDEGKVTNAQVSFRFKSHFISLLMSAQDRFMDKTPVSTCADVVGFARAHDNKKEQCTHVVFVAITRSLYAVHTCGTTAAILL